jgi:hypothetical protein
MRLVPRMSSTGIGISQRGLQIGQRSVRRLEWRQLTFEPMPQPPPEGSLASNGVRPAEPISDFFRSDHAGAGPCFAAIALHRHMLDLGRQSLGLRARPMMELAARLTRQLASGGDHIRHTLVAETVDPGEAVLHSGQRNVTGSAQFSHGCRADPLVGL